LPARADPGLVAELAAAATECSLWRIRLTDARNTVDEALRRLHVAEDRLPGAQLCWLGVRTEADRASVARARRAPTEARQVAEALRAELLAITAKLADQVQVAPRELRLYPALVEAEWSRVVGTPEPDAWQAAVTRADELRDPYLGAYARWRLAEAVLEGDGSRRLAEEPLREAHRTAVRLGAAPLEREVESLARRARIDLEERPEPSTEAVAVPRDPFGLTTREIEVLALVAQGRTNRQIADELFITEKTAGHHVSNLLGKLGAATRGEAAAIAHRLQLLGRGDPR